MVFTGAWKPLFSEKMPVSPGTEVKAATVTPEGAGGGVPPADDVALYVNSENSRFPPTIA